jgi:hypothetical protein
MLPAQSLIADTEKILKARTVLSGKQTDTVARTSAAAEVLAMLYHYHKPVTKEGITQDVFNQLRVHYVGHPLLQDAINDVERLEPPILQAAVRQAAEMQKAPTPYQRDEILGKLYSQSIGSPSDYLSPTASLQRFQSPERNHMEALQQSATKNNKNIRGSALTSQAAALEGIALFVLDRAKEEVLINFLEQVLNEDSPRMQSFFPTVVGEFKDVSFTYSESFISRLRYAFYADLQQLSVRLPVLVLEDPYFEDLQSDPVAFNLLALWSIGGLSQQDVPLEQAIPITSRFLYEGYLDSERKIIESIVDSAGNSAQFRALHGSVDLFWAQLVQTIQVLGDTEYQIDEQIAEAQENNPEATAPPLASDFLDGRLHQANAIIGTKVRGFHLGDLPDLLLPNYSDAYLRQFNTVESYDRLISSDVTIPQRQATGLDLIYKLRGTWFQEKTIPQILASWCSAMENYETAAQIWISANQAKKMVQLDETQLEKARNTLYEKVNAEAKYWQNTKVHPPDLLLLTQLPKLLEPNAWKNIATQAILDNPKNDKTTASIKAWSQLLEQVAARLESAQKTLAVQYPNEAKMRPTQQSKMATQNRTESVSQDVKTKIVQLEYLLDSVLTKLTVLEQTVGQKKISKRENAKPMLQLTELSTNLMYCLYTGGAESKWMTVNQLESMLDGGEKQQVFLGLMQHRLSQVHSVGRISNTGLAQLVRQTVADLSLLQKNEAHQANDSLAEPEAGRFHKRATFVLHSFNRLIELPLVSTGLTQLQSTSLGARDTRLKSIPVVSNHALDFVYHLNTKNHSQAINSLLKLLGSMNKMTEQNSLVKNNEAYQKRENALEYLHKYGDFISGVIDAREAQQVKYLLEEIADPPGTSRLKRTSRNTISLNAYLGLAGIMERWTDQKLSANDQKWAPTAALTMPIGVTWSWLTRRNKQSFSLFVSMLDLGAILHFRDSDSALAQTDLTFKNMFKPGAQIHWNIKKSPFYLGVGWQTGPQFVRINDVQSAVQSNRVFLGFGVDVPIRTLYKR